MVRVWVCVTEGEVLARRYLFWCVWVGGGRMFSSYGAPTVAFFGVFFFFFNLYLYVVFSFVLGFFLCTVHL